MKISLEEVARIRQTQGVGRAHSGSQQRVGRAAGPGIPAAATVELSEKAQEIQRVKKLVQAAPDIREEMVQSIKSRIESGTYNVSGAEVADLMVRRALADTIE